MSDQDHLSVEQEVAAEAKKTEFGQILYRYRHLFFVFLGLLFVGAIGYSFWHTQSQDKAQAAQEEVYLFQNDILEQIKAKKISASEIVQKLEGLLGAIDDPARALVVVQKIQDELRKDKNLQGAKEVLSSYWPYIKQNNYAKQFIGMNLAALCDDLGDYSTGVEVLKELTQVPGAKEINSAQYHLNLGRFYKELKNEEEAKKAWQKLVDQYPNAQEAKMAKLFIAQLGGAQ